jgi:hypothetical protein
MEEVKVTHIEKCENLNKLEMLKNKQSKPIQLSMI